MQFPTRLALIALASCAADGPRCPTSYSMQGPMLVGACTRVDLEEEPFGEWFRAEYEAYPIDAEHAQALGDALAGCRIEAFFGTWCGDSRRGIPSLVKALDAAEFPAADLSLYALSDNPGEFKQMPSGLARARLIHRTPTILVYRDGELQGRIVEVPRERLELDLVRIARSEPYEAQHAFETRVHELIFGESLYALERERNSLIEAMQVGGRTETLLHYAQFDLLWNDHVDEAVAVLDLIRAANRARPPAPEPGLFGASTSLPPVTYVDVDGARFGAEPDARGPIGGGPGYEAGPERRDHVARTLDELVAALAKAGPGEVVFIPGDAVLDCTARVLIDELVLELPGGVTLASDRGIDGSAGALLASDALQTRPLIRVLGANARISGLRLRGPDPERRLDHHRRAYREKRGSDYYYSLPTSDGIECSFDGLEVDNCELAGWSHAAIYLRQGTGHQIHHSFLHHNQRQGLGYGVCHDVAESTIERNLFDWNRHSIAGTGRPGSGYEATHNVERGASLSHLFDMHGGRDRKDGTNIAGTWMRIERNAFLCPEVAVKVRGVPEQRVWVAGNWFLHPGPRAAVVGEDRTELGANAYGINAPAVR